MPAAVLWKACTTAEGLARWQADEVSGGLDVGRFSLAWPALGASLDLEVVNARELERVVFRGAAMMLELAIADGSVSVTISGEPGSDAAGLASSWNASLALLEHSAQAHRDCDRSVHWFAKPVRASAEAVHVFFTEPAALATWLGRGHVGAEGERARIALGCGEVVEGRVLARAHERDVVISWDGAASALSMRTLPIPGRRERIVALALSRWCEADAPPATLGALENAVSRLAWVLGAGGDA